MGFGRGGGGGGGGGCVFFFGGRVLIWGGFVLGFWGVLFSWVFFPGGVASDVTLSYKHVCK